MGRNKKEVAQANAEQPKGEETPVKTRKQSRFTEDTENPQVSKDSMKGKQTIQNDPESAKQEQYFSGGACT